QHQRLEAPTLVTCGQCGKLRQAHRVCKNCGTYRNRQVIEVNEANLGE
ncbi:MAG TPA: 50S ribosomal protein L32, partial [Roseiflexaceae bacterium]|nr:50S ribosomal protein L32 [Roseiflexaceae bacterium]